MNAVNKKYIHIIIMVILMFAIGALSPVYSLTPYGMQVLGVFVGILYGWIFIDLIWPSIFGFVALGSIGTNTIVGTFCSGFGNMSLMMVLLPMLFAGALEEAGVTDFLANWFLKRKFVRRSPWFLVAGLVALSFVLGVLQAGLAAVFVVWALVIKVADECNIPRENHLVSFLIFMVVATAFTSALIMPFAPGSLMWGAFYPAALSVPYPSFMAYAAIVLATVCTGVFLAGKIILRLDASSFVLSQKTIAELDSKKSTKAQKIGFAILVVYMLALLLPGIMPTVMGMAALKKIGVVGMSALALLVMAVLVVEGKPLISLEKTFTKHTQWTLILLLAVTFPLGDAIKSADAGIIATSNQIFTPLVSNMGIGTFMILSMAFLGMLTQVTHNIVLGAAFIPLLCPLCESLGGNGIVMWFVLFFMLQCAYITPAASMNSALVHGHERMIKKDAYILGAIFFLVELIVLAILGIPLGNIMF